MLQRSPPGWHGHQSGQNDAASTLSAIAGATSRTAWLPSRNSRSRPCSRCSRTIPSNDWDLLGCSRQAQVSLLAVFDVRFQFLPESLPALHGRLRQRQLSRVPPRLPHPGQRPARRHPGQAMSLQQRHPRSGTCQFVGCCRATDAAANDDHLGHRALHLACLPIRLSTRRIRGAPHAPAAASACGRRQCAADRR